MGMKGGASRWLVAGAWTMALAACGDGDGAGTGPVVPRGSAVGSRTADGGRDVDLCSCSAGSGLTRLPLGCLCPDAAKSDICQSSLAGFDGPGACDRAPGTTVVRTTGCGRVRFGLADIVFAGRETVFDQATGRLIGILEFSDIPVVACGAWQVLYGDGLFLMAKDDSSAVTVDVCPKVETCTVCGQAKNAPPLCP